MRSLLFCISLLAFSPARAQQPSMPLAADAIHRLESDIPELLKESNVPGMSIALIRDGRVVWAKGFGVSSAVTKKPVTVHTIFEAASLSKCVFAYAVLRLVDEGKLDLDTPLNRYLGNNYDVVNDDRINLITARHVLTHTSGFPNWRDADGTKDLLIHFTPGTKWSYSGEGMVYLSKVVEKITGMRFEAFMQHYALQPLGMHESSYIWRSRFDTLKAYRHDDFGELTGRNQPDNGREDTLHDDGNAAASLATTPLDYSKFIIAILDGKGLKKATWLEMLKPQVRADERYPPLAWGLGVGLETMPEGEYFWHWGDNGDAKAYVTAAIVAKSAVVYFADGADGLSFVKEILADAIGGDHPALAHLGYERYNSPGRQLAKTTMAKGATEALKEYRRERAMSGDTISEQEINMLGYLLIRHKKLDEAIEVFSQNTADFPNSWNVWDSLAEAYMDQGNKELAIKYYQKSIQLNPANTNGMTQLKKLQ